MPVTQTIQTVLFDLDGTLVDSAPDLAAAADKMRTDRGLPSLPYENYRYLAGAGARGMLQAAFDMKPTDNNYEHMREEFFRNYENTNYKGTHLFDGMLELLQTLEQRQILWGIVTNKMERFTLPFIHAATWAKHTNAIIAGDTTPHMKPHPLPVLEGAKQTNTPPQNCLYVGDDLRDIQAGNAAGTITVAATWGYLGETNDVTQWKAHHTIYHPMDIITLL